MNDSMKFGPEWLRNMSNDSSSSSTGGTNTSTQRFPLAEFRYGREEMLSLFDKSLKVPDILPKFKSLFVEKIQLPLALTPSTEDDQAPRIWPVRSSPGIGLSTRGSSRGGLIDRGRGRARSTYHPLGGYQRPSSLFDEEGGRGMGRGERWSERNGTDQGGEWMNASMSLTSPRKEYNSHGGRGGSVESWRRSRDDELPPSEQWRSGSSNMGPREPTKWGRSTSWREEDPNAGEQRMYNNDRSYDRTMSGGRNIPMNRKPWDMDDNLPEWAVENPLESGGSFDASGAFHGSDDDGPNGSDHYENEKSPDEMMKKDLEDGRSKSTPSSEINAGDEDNDETDVLKSDSLERTKSDSNIQEQISVIVTTSTTIISSSTITTTTTQQASMANIGDMRDNLPKMAQSVDRMQEVADDMVEKLIMDDELMVNNKNPAGNVKPGGLIQANRGKMVENVKAPPVSMNPVPGMGAIPSLTAVPEDPKAIMWYYRDPQDMVQGPFTAVEMAEWYQAGYFDDNLCVRRIHDQRFSKLGDLIEMCGGEMPFFAPYRALPMQMSQDAQMKAVPPMMGPKQLNPMMELESYQILRQNYLLKQQALVYQKLSTSDVWHMLPPDQQRQMINKHVAQIAIPENVFGLQAANAASVAAGDSPMIPFQLMELMNVPNKPPMPPNPMQMENNVDLGNILDPAVVMHEKKMNHLPQPPMHFPGMMPNNQQPDFGLVAGNSAANPLNQLLHSMRMFPPQQNSPLNPMQQHHGPLPPMMGHPMPGQQAPTQPSDLYKNDISNSDRIKSLLMQLSMQKGMQPPPNAQMMSQHLQQQPPKSNMIPNSHWFNPTDQLKSGHVGGVMPNAGGWMGEMAANSNNGVERVPGSSIWDLEQKTLNQAKHMEATMKTEKQVLEDHLAMANLMNEEQQQQDLEQQRQRAAEAAREAEHPWQHVGMDNRSRQMENLGRDKKKEDNVDKSGNKKKDSGVKAASASNGNKSSLKQVELEEKKRMEESSAKRKDSQQQPKGEQLKGDDKRDNGQSGGSKGNKINNRPSSKAPWSNSNMTEMPGLSLAEIQKMELEQQRAEQIRLDILQQQQQQWFDLQNAKSDPILQKWNAPQIGPSVVKSLAEIQAEEQAKLRAEQENAPQAAIANNVQLNASSKKEDIWTTSPQSAVWSSLKTWRQQQPPPSSAGGFWEEPVKVMTSSSMAMTASNLNNNVAAKNNGAKTIAKSQTMSSIQTKSPNVNANSVLSNNAKVAAAGGPKQKQQSNNGTAVAAVAGSSSVSSAKKDKEKGAKAINKKDDASGQEFTTWCTKTLSAMNSTVDIPTFVSFLQDIESPYEVKDYIRLYLGETKECSEFAKHFLERRSKYKNQIRAQNAHVDDMCSPAPAITPSSDFQEGKQKKIKKNKMMKLDARILGFSVTAAQDRLNVGDRDYPQAS